MKTLTANQVLYLSHGDEDSFFAWLKSIECVGDVRGLGDDLLIEVDETTVSDTDLRELVALFYRYDVDMKQLQQFVTDENSVWFRDEKEAFWHDAVFGPV